MAISHPSQPVRPRANWMPPPPIDPALAGSVEIDAPAVMEAGSHQTFALTYRAGRFGIDDTGALRVCFRFASDGGQPQFADPAAANYVTVAASNGATLDIRYDFKLNTRPWDRTIAVRVVKGFLSEGDTIRLCFGPREGGSPGFRLQSFCDPFFAPLVLVDPIATGQFVRVPEDRSIAIVAGPATCWQAIVPTRWRVGEAFALGLRATDRWGNPADARGRRFRPVAAGGVRGLPDAIAYPAGASSIRIAGLVATASGPVEIRLVGDDEAEIAANPLVAVEAAERVACWGDLHAQSAETIGSGSAPDYLRFARDEAFLHVVGHQGNDFQITQAFWRELNDLFRAFDEPGRFVTIPGYEWSGNTALGGDRNVFFFEAHRPIRRSSHALVPDRSDEAQDCHDARALFAALRRDKENAVCWAHCGGRYADLSYAHDIDLERAIEIHSGWGTFEWLLNDAFDLGYRVGIVANSDGHKGRPGAEPPGASMFGAQGGLTCFRVPGLTRAHVFEAMRARHHYGTTGCRLDLDVRATLARPGRLYRDDPAVPGALAREAHGGGMGDILRTGEGDAVIDVTLSAPAPILEIELRNGRETVETIRPYGERRPGRRFLATWSGAEYRGRFRQTVWDGRLRVDGAAIVGLRGVNFFNPDIQPELASAREVRWRSATTGNFAGIEIRLDDPEPAVLTIETPHGRLHVTAGELGPAPVGIDCGGLERKLRVRRLPDDNPHRAHAFARRVPLRADRDNPIYVAVTLEDGHQAWSSPIYLIRPEGVAER